MDELAPGRPRRDELGMFIGLVEMLAGGLSALYVVVGGWKTTIINSPTHLGGKSQLGGTSLLLAMVLVAMAYAGWRLWRGDRLGYRLSAALIGLQIFHLVLPGFQFTLVCPIGFGLGWTWDGPGEGVAIANGYGLAVWIARASSVTDSYLWVNGVALAAVIYLISRSRRDRDELELPTVRSA
jgi:hypothetical protein